jgi:hypothetical protein
MSDQDTKRILEKAFPELPPIVKSRIRETIAHTEPEKSIRHHGIFPRALLAALLLLAIGMAAVAAMQQMGVLHFTQSYMNEAVYDTLPEANELVHKDLAVVERPDVIVRVEEAAYDGRTLQIMYSITRRNATAPFDKQAVENGDYVYDIHDNGNMGGCDWLVVNGVNVELLLIETSAGEENGQLLFYLESNLEPPGGAKPLRPTGKMTVGLPIQPGGKEGPVVPDGLTFTMDVGDATTRYSLKLPEPVEVRGCRIQFSDLHFSPIQVSMTYTITIPASMAAGKTAPELDTLIGSFANGILENDRGEQLGHGKYGPSGGPINRMENGDLVVEANERFTPSSQYTPVIYLVTRGGDRLPIPMEQAGK